MRFPTIHLNGSNPETLLKVYKDATHTLSEAIQALSDAAPHGRDYYVQSDEAYLEARREHEARLKLLEDVRKELLAISQDIRKQLDERKQWQRNRKK